MPYRDELEALRHREAQLTRELSETRELRRAAEGRAAPLPMLESLRVASPCASSWDDMIGDDRVRFCGSCAKNVYDLSAMTRAEAEEFVAARPSAVCVTFRRRADGKVMTSDCPVGARRHRFAIGAMTFGALGAAALGSMLAAAPHPSRALSHRDEPIPKHGDAPNDARVLEYVGTFTTTGSVAHPTDDAKPRTNGRTTGCLCQRGDPLCSCL